MLVVEIFQGLADTNFLEIRRKAHVSEPFLDRHLSTLRANGGKLLHSTQVPV